MLLLTLKEGVEERIRWGAPGGRGRVYAIGYSVSIGFGCLIKAGFYCGRWLRFVACWNTPELLQASERYLVGKLRKCPVGPDGLVRSDCSLLSQIYEFIFNYL